MIRREYFVRRNVKFKEWVDSTYEDEAQRQIAWEAFSKLIELHPACADELRGETIWSESKVLEA